MTSQKPKFAQPANKKKQEEDMDNFAAKAEQEENDTLKPWETSENELKNIPLYLPKAYTLKLKYMSDVTGVPQQRILRDILMPGIDDRLEKVEKGMPIKGRN